MSWPAVYLPGGNRRFSRLLERAICCLGFFYMLFEYINSIRVIGIYGDKRNTSGKGKMTFASK